MKALNAEKLNALVDARVQADVDSGKVGGAALCVVQDGKVLLHKTYGYQNVDTKQPLLENALFRLASMTKPITAAAALIAQDMGLLSIDDPLCKYIPAYASMKIGHMENGQPVYDKDATTPITIKHLLSHTSGLGTLEIGDHDWAQMPDELAKSPAGVMEWLSDKMLAFEPYTAQWYSPVAAFVAVARIIEIVSGIEIHDLPVIHDQYAVRVPGHVLHGVGDHDDVAARVLPKLLQHLQYVLPPLTCRDNGDRLRGWRTA